MKLKDEKSNYHFKVPVIYRLSYLHERSAVVSNKQGNIIILDKGTILLILNNILFSNAQQVVR